MITTAQDRTLVIHHDDLGGSHSANMAFVELFDLGIVTCGSVMVPCPWFAEMASLARERPELDLGVHLTLTSEFARYRWRPLTGGGRGRLTDPSGHFWASVAEARQADASVVEAELRAQIDTALEAGIDVTHLDAHMGVAWQPEFIDLYLRLGRDYALPIVLTRDVASMAPRGARYEAAFDALTARGNPDFQAFLTTPFGDLSPSEAVYADILQGARPGLNWGGFHFTAPGDIDMLTADAPTRLAEYALFRSGRAKALVDAEGLLLSGMRCFRDEMRGGNPA